MTEDWDQESDLVAAGTNCPMPDCGALTLTYRPKCWDAQTADEPWEFKCPRCGVEFMAFENDLLFRSIRREWLRAGIYSA